MIFKGMQLENGNIMDVFIGIILIIVVVSIYFILKSNNKKNKKKLNVIEKNVEKSNQEKHHFIQ